MGTVRKSYPRFRREGGAPRIVLTEDDFAVLLCIYRHRFVRADDLYRLFGHRSRDRLSRRLTWLYRNQFLDRPIAQIDRFREGPTQALVYGLDNAGARVVAERFGVPTGSADWRSRNRAFTRENLELAFGGVLRHFVLGGADLHDDDDARTVSVFTDDEKPFVVYDKPARQVPT